jgi:hypothetical protein
LRDFRKIVRKQEEEINLLIQVQYHTLYNYRLINYIDTNAFVGFSLKLP